MVHALGYCQSRFDPASPGRLCRGRERWVEGYAVEPPVEMHRLVLSGACFSDDTARDALRGLGYSGLGTFGLLEALFPGQPLLAFCEQGEPGCVPAGAVLAEPFVQPRQGGRRMDPCVRWRVPIPPGAGAEILPGGEVRSADGFVPRVDPLPAALEEALYLLTAFGERMVFPQRRFQPSALADVLAVCPWIACLHLDKHGDALAIYSREPLDVEDALGGLCAGRNVLLVPFSIPPMLARWDRAVYELRLSWDRSGGEFPVPPGDVGSSRRPVATYEHEE